MWNYSLLTSIRKVTKIHNVMCSFLSTILPLVPPQIFLSSNSLSDLIKTISDTSLNENDELEATNSLHEYRNNTDRMN